MRKASLFLVLFVLVLEMGSIAHAESLPKLTFGMLPIIDSLPLIVAEERGYFRGEGVEVELINFASALERDSALQAGRIDGHLGDIISTLLLKEGGVSVSIVSLSLGSTPQEGVIAILSSPRSGIERIEDLKNVPIGLSSDTLIEYVVDRLLEKRGFKPSEIAKAEVKQIPLRYQMLMGGQLKVVSLPDPLASLAVSQGARLIIDDSQDNLSQSILLFTDDQIARKREAIRAFLRAYKRAVEIVNADPNSFRGLLVEKGRLPAPIKDTYQVGYFPPPQPPKPEEIADVARWLFDKKLVKKMYSFQDVVDDSLLP